MKKVENNTILGFALALFMCVITPDAQTKVIQIMIWLIMLGSSLFILHVRQNPDPKKVRIPATWSADDEQQTSLVRSLLKLLSDLIAIMELGISIGIYFESVTVLLVSVILFSTLMLVAIFYYSHKIDKVITKR